MTAGCSPTQWRCRRASAAVEFALVCPVLLVLLGGLADTGLLIRSQMRLAAGVAGGAQYALLAGMGVDAAALRQTVQRASGLSSVTVTVTGPFCGCPAGQPTARRLVAQGCGTPCPDASAPGTYLTLTGQYAYPPLMPQYSHLATTQRAETATVLLK